MADASQWLSAGDRETRVLWVGDQDQRPVVQSGVHEGEEIVVYCHESVPATLSVTSWVDSTLALMVFSVCTHVRWVYTILIPVVCWASKKI